MKTVFKAALAAALFSATALGASAPALAQVNGMASVDAPLAIVRSQALQTGFQSIATQYAAQRETISQRGQQRQTLIRSLDTNANGNLDETEAAVLQNPQNATAQQIQALDNEMQTLQAPIDMARLYVVEQVAMQYLPALQQVVSDRSIQIVFAPGAIVYQPDAADISALVATALNTRVPSVNVTPPAGWQPTEQLIGIYQQVQQILVAAQQQQAAQAAQAGAAAPATTGR